MKTIFILPLMLVLNFTAYADDTQVNMGPKVNQFQPTINTIRVSTRPEIVGLWGMNLNLKNQCIEYYNFKSNNQLVVKSAKEWSTGFYEYEPRVNGDDQRDTLTIHITYDNNEVDCSGSQVDQSDELSQYSVKWKNAKSFELCNIEKVDECFATLKRVLP